MDKAREKHVKKMERLKEAADRTESKYLRRDYLKAYHRMKADLEEYDAFRSGK